MLRKVVLFIGMSALVQLSYGTVANACGVKLSVKAPRVKRPVAQSTQPTTVLVLGDAPNRLVGELNDAGHEVDTADNIGGAKKKQYRLVIADPGMEGEARAKWPGATVVTRSGSTRSVMVAVEDSLVRNPTAYARRPIDGQQRRPIAAGPNDVRRPIAAGPTLDEATPAAAPAPAAIAATPPAAAAAPAATARTPEPSEAPAAKPAKEPRVATVEKTRKRPDVVEETRSAEPEAKPEPVRAAKAKMGREAFFGSGSSELSDKAHARLKATAEWLSANPGKSVIIEGHASSVGNSQANQVISEARANAAKDALVSLGVDASRIQVMGFGSDKPAYEPSTSPKNRRISIRVNE